MNDALQTMRQRLDAIDAELLNLIKQRLDCCQDIGRFKKANQVPVMQPQRVGIVKNRAAEFARRNGVSEDFLLRLYDVIIAETCRLEEEIVGD